MTDAQLVLKKNYHNKKYFHSLIDQVIINFYAVVGVPLSTTFFYSSFAPTTE